MARDKLITIRIEGEKREAFNNLAKSQNTDTASLLYDFINQCLSGTLDISLVTGKGNRIDKIDNQIGSDRIDKLETATQEIDDCLSVLAEKLDDCDRALWGKIESLEDRLKALSIQLDSQRDSQQIDDMEPLLKRERESSIASPIETVESGSEPISSINEPATSSIASLTEKVSCSPLDRPAIEAVPTTHKAIADRLGFKSQTKLNYWIKNGKIPAEYADRCHFNPNKTKILWL